MYELLFDSNTTLWYLKVVFRFTAQYWTYIHWTWKRRHEIRWNIFIVSHNISINYLYFIFRLFKINNSSAFFSGFNCGSIVILPIYTRATILLPWIIRVCINRSMHLFILENLLSYIIFLCRSTFMQTSNSNGIEKCQTTMQEKWMKHITSTVKHYECNCYNVF